MIAALYVAKNGAYYGLPGVDPWDEARDARLYKGPYPVVAHPPCSRWCMLAKLIEARYGHKVGDDGGCFASALESVREFGGVLEHPAYSRAWAHYGLQRPAKGGGWVGGPREWTCQVSQSLYGHRARKKTWLLYCGPKPPELRWGDKPGTHYVGDDPGKRKPALSKKEAKATPLEFREELLRLARHSTPTVIP